MNINTDLSEHHIWDGTERRRNPTPQVPADNQEFWTYVMGQFDTVSIKLNALHMDMISHKTDIKHIHDDVESIKRAFPKDEEGSRDYDGHKDHHDSIIKTSKKWSEIGNDVLKKVFGGVAWIVLVFVCMSLWDSFKKKLGQ